MTSMLLLCSRPDRTYSYSCNRVKNFSSLSSQGLKRRGTGGNGRKNREEWPELTRQWNCKRIQRKGNDNFVKFSKSPEKPIHNSPILAARFAASLFLIPFRKKEERVSGRKGPPLAKQRSIGRDPMKILGRTILRGEKSPSHQSFCGTR